MPRQLIKLKHKFITKLLISHILLASVPIIFTGAVLIGTASNTFIRSYKNRIFELVKHSAVQINMALENAEQILKLNATDILVLNKSRLSQELVLNGIINRFPIFRDLKLLDANGKILISTSFIDDSTEYMGKEFFADVSVVRRYQSQVFLSEDMLPSMRIAEPIIQYEEHIGTLMAEINLKEMWDLIEGSVIGEKAQAFIFDKTGKYIAHSERKRVYLGEKFSEPEILKEVALGVDNQRIYRNRDRIKMVAAYVSLPMLGWGVVFQQPTNEAFILANRMKSQIVLLVVISILLSSFIAVIYTRWIVTPVNQLVSGIDRISTGDLQYRIPQLGKDEISTLAEQFNEMTAKLQDFQNKLKRTERLETLNKLASVLSHEIKNPLNAMVINMQIMEREFRKPSLRPEKLRHYLSIVAGEIQRVDDLVNNFLLVARPPKLDRKTTNLCKLLDDIILTQQADALQSGVRVNRRYQLNDVPLSIDETKIKQVFLNIFLNATQAMPGGGHLTIELEQEKTESKKTKSEFVIVKFKDSGKGIKKEHLSRIFDFYYSTNEGGTGLGLSVAQQIIEEHGGKIEVHSRENVGSVFSVYLPKNKSK